MKLKKAQKEDLSGSKSEVNLSKDAGLQLGRSEDGYDHLLRGK
jgi:hypothetical protein